MTVITSSYNINKYRIFNTYHSRTNTQKTTGCHLSLFCVVLHVTITFQEVIVAIKI